MNDLIIIGAGAGGQSIYNWFRDRGVVGFLDDNKDLKDKCVEGIPVLGTTKDLNKFKGYNFVVALGKYLKVREQLFKLAKKAGLKPVTLIHKTAIIHETAYIGGGTVILANCVVGPHAQIHDNVFLFTNTIVEHDNIISNGVYTSPGTCLAGNVYIGKNTFLGINSCVVQGINVGSNVIIGAGVVVIKHVKDYNVVIGNPAKLLYLNK